ncbi:hypothetical protein TGAM01_v209262 [Trichoderma gamsii]|uniref:Uncharacterized protein n=1 Tax=Trichoderma gamsii TaxID=398673 RepID=A0A2P4ZC11_9HYPO|nr:hypothetical protein TGAM01_v209262 [Trichoderma gamsii]PON21832.1 hypothetical protein TGAM01_v209262 [Trichoderma gamsii]
MNPADTTGVVIHDCKGKEAAQKKKQFPTSAWKFMPMPRFSRSSSSAQATSGLALKLKMQAQVRKEPEAIPTAL